MSEQQPQQELSRFQRVWRAIGRKPGALIIATGLIAGGSLINTDNKPDASKPTKETPGAVYRAGKAIALGNTGELQTVTDLQSVEARPGSYPPPVHSVTTVRVAARIEETAESKTAHKAYADGTPHANDLVWTSPYLMAYVDSKGGQDRHSALTTFIQDQRLLPTNQPTSITAEFYPSRHYPDGTQVELDVCQDVTLGITSNTPEDYTGCRALGALIFENDRWQLLAQHSDVPPTLVHYDDGSVLV